MSESQGSGVKVTDNRRIDGQGNERIISENSEGGDGSAGAVSGANFEIKDPPKDSVSPEITFGSFVMSLATQALMQLGEIPPPPGMSIPVDKEGAKQSIDIISMLEVKTRGNLDANEQRLMREVLHNLRMSFVAKKG